jgi:hypothetical protein
MMRKHRPKSYRQEPKITYNAHGAEHDSQEDVQWMHNEKQSKLAVQQREQTTAKEECRSKERKEIDKREDLQQHLNAANISSSVLSHNSIDSSIQTHMARIVLLLLLVSCWPGKSPYSTEEFNTMSMAHRHEIKKQLYSRKGFEAITSLHHRITMLTSWGI